MGKYRELFERFRLADSDQLDLPQLSVEQLAQLTPQELRERAREFFDPENKPYPPGEDPGITRVRFDALKREATEELASELNQTFGEAGSGKRFLARGVDTLQVTDEGQFTGKTAEFTDFTRTKVEYDWGTMLQLRDRDTGQIITATKLPEGES